MCLVRASFVFHCATCGICNSQHMLIADVQIVCRVLYMEMKVSSSKLKWMESSVCRAEAVSSENPRTKRNWQKKRSNNKIGICKMAAPKHTQSRTHRRSLVNLVFNWMEMLALYLYGWAVAGNVLLLQLHERPIFCLAIQCRVHTEHIKRKKQIKKESCVHVSRRARRHKSRIEQRQSAAETADAVTRRR